MLTVNVWDDSFRRAERTAALLQLIKESKADIVGLQEVTSEVLNLITTDDYVCQHFYVSDAIGHTLSGNGLLLLSRLPVVEFVQHEVSSNMKRSLLSAQLFINGHSLCVAVVQLESKDDALVRESQLVSAAKFLNQKYHYVLMGDFNCRDDANMYNHIASRGESETGEGEAGTACGGPVIARLPCHVPPHASNDSLRLYLPGAIDLWPQLHSTSSSSPSSKQPGFTVDSKTNRMLMYDEQCRYDRVLLRSSGEWTATRISLTGFNELHIPLPPGSERWARNQRAVFMSKHYGLIAELMWRDGDDDVERRKHDEWQRIAEMKEMEKEKLNQVNSPLPEQGMELDSKLDSAPTTASNCCCLM